MRPKIVIAYDATPAAADGLALGALLADLRGADLVVARVLEDAASTEATDRAAQAASRRTLHHEVLLLARTREHFVESRDGCAALAFGLRRTAAVATGAAAVMVAAAVPFVFSDLINVRQFGIGLAIAATLDTLIVRPVLLPAAVRLGRWSWWPTVPHGARSEVPRPVPPTAPRGAS